MVGGGCSATLEDLTNIEQKDAKAKPGSQSDEAPIVLLASTSKLPYARHYEGLVSVIHILNSAERGADTSAKYAYSS